MKPNQITDSDIIPLPKDKWQNTIIPMRYTTEEYYDLQTESGENGYSVKLEKCRFEHPVTHSPEEYDFPDKLYQPHWEKAYAWGVVQKDKLLACIETCPEEWSNRLVITELWVDESIRRQGVAHKLMAIAKRQAVMEHRRALILETQSCNTGAISFYQSEGFELIGFDNCCYSNRDVQKKEVRINLGYFPRKTRAVNKEDLVIRREEPSDYRSTEKMALQAFWNKYQPGCDEHLLVRKLRDCSDYVPELSRIAVIDGEIAGAICYSKAWLKKGNETKEILTFGPLCVAPEWQGCGIGGMLLEETLNLAKEAGYAGIVIFGEADYYPLHGFRTCDHFGITTADGKNSDSFLGIELKEGALTSFGGRFYESDVFDDLPIGETDQLAKTLDAPPKQKFPSQWK